MSTNFSSDDFFAFLREATLAGRMAPVAAKSRRAAAEMLFTKLADGESADLRTLDIDALKSRFLDAQSDGVRSEVVELYAVRLREALDDYFRFVDSPTTFTSVATRAQASRRRDESSPRTAQERALESVRLSAPRQRPDVVPVALNEDRVVYLHGIPTDLTPQEARKIARVVEALADEPGGVE
jgi:hypothetical protein